MLKQAVSTSTEKRVQYLHLRAEAVALFKTVAEIQKVSQEELFAIAVRPTCYRWLSI